MGKENMTIVAKVLGLKLGDKFKVSRPGFDDAVYHISEKGLYAYIDRLGKWMHAGANL